MKRLKSAVVATMVLLGSFSNIAYGEVRGVVIADHVNMRQTPESSSEVLKKLELGQGVAVVDSRDEWYNIASDSQDFGWVHNKLVVATDAENDFIKTGIVQADSLNVRENPNVDANIVQKLNGESKVTVTEEKDGWYKIVSDTQEKGWVKSDYMTVKPNYTKGIVCGNDVNVRMDSSTNSEIVTRVGFDQNVLIKGFKDGWYNIIVEEGMEGFIHNKYVRVSSSNKPTSRSMGRSTASINLVNIAKAQLGKRYVYGSAGPNSFDCSGFTSYVYKKVGKKIPRTSRAQATVGTKVSKSELRMGDLVLFTGYRDRGRIGHVGIYIGDGKFIHASSGKRTRKVMISSLNEKHYVQRYKTARRVLQ